MQITRTAAKERILLDALRASFGADERTGVHLSDLLKPRRAFWQRTLPIPPADASVLYFLAGRGHEEVFARLAGVQVGATEAKRVEIPGFVSGEQRFKYGINYRPDFRWDGRPTEFKTRRRNLAREGEESVQYDGYLEQLRGYCTLDGVAAGNLIVFSLLEGSSFNDPLKPSQPELAVYEVEFSDEDCAQMAVRLREARHDFEVALESKSHAHLPLCAAWMCGKNRKVVIRAAHCVECDKALAEPWASKHTRTKSGAGHTVEPEVVRWEYEPRCPHYVFCQPQAVDPLRGVRRS